MSDNNTMTKSDTPRTDQNQREEFNRSGKPAVCVIFTRQLERELNTAKKLLEDERFKNIAHKKRWEFMGKHYGMDDDWCNVKMDEAEDSQ